MKKRIVSLLLALVLAASLLPVQAWGATLVDSGECGADGGNVTWTLDSDKVLTISGTGAMHNYHGNNHAPWYSNRYNIKDVQILDGVTTIGNFAFAECSNLINVTIPNSVTSIGEYAFEFCSRLTNVNIPNSVTSIESEAFFCCSSLTSVTIPNSVTSIDGFRGCSSLTDVSIPDSVTSIRALAFDGCSSLTSVTIPNSVTSIGSSAFEGCSSLTSVNIPNSVTKIGSGAFSRCSSLLRVSVDTQNPSYCAADDVLFNKEMTELIQYPAGKPDSNYRIPSSVTAIEGYAFDGCSNLTSVTIPNSMTSIGWYAFYGCSSLTNVSIPNSVTSIGNYAFDGCSNLTNVNIPNSVTSIGDTAFFGCRSLTNVSIPNGVKSIEWRTFEYCSSLTSVSIPNSVRFIGEDAFYDCSSLTDVYYSDSEEQWKAITIRENNGCLISATIHYNSTGPAPTSIYTAKPGKLALAVYENRNGSDVRETAYRLSKGASVSSGSASAVTDAGGQASVAYTGGAVTVSKTGYVSRTVSEAALKVNPQVWLQQESDDPVISAVWMDEVNDIMNAEYSLPLVQSEAHNVSVEVNWGKSSMKSLMLAQGTATVALSGSGQTSVTWSDHFDLSKTILVVATNAEGKRSSKVLKITADSKKTNKLEGFSFGCGDTLGFTLPDSIPILGGTEMKLGVYSPVPIQYTIEDGKIYLAIGFQMDGTDDDLHQASVAKQYVDAAKVLKKSVSSQQGISAYQPVSYTHLTLPTKA